MGGDNVYTNFSGTTVLAQRLPDSTYFLYNLLIVLFHVGLLNLLAVVGLAGNTISIIVLRKHGVTKDSTNVMLIALSIFDFMYSLTAIIRSTPFFFVLTDKKFATRLDNVFQLCSIYYIDQFCIITSVTITSAIAIERFVAVFFPFTVARIFTPFRVKLAVIFIFLYVFGIVSPLFDHFVLVTLINTKNITEVILRKTDWWVSSRMPYYSEIWCNNLLGTANMAIVFLCGATTTLKLAYLAHTRQRLTSNKTPVTDMKAHKMILIVCGTCFLVFFPTTAHDIASNFGFTMTIIKLLVPNLLYGVHASVNFIIYVAVSRKFYITFKNIICRNH